MKSLFSIFFLFNWGLLCVVDGTDTYAQSTFSLDPAKALTQYVHKAWQVDEGLPQNTVLTILQTQDGYLWLGTEEGLTRFDGVRFTVFDKSNTAAFEAGQTIRALLEDQKGTLWIGTMGGGLIQYASGQFIRYTAQYGLSGKVIAALCQDASGDLWVGTRDAGLFRFNDGRFTQFTTKDGLSSDHISALHQDRAGGLWVGTAGGLNRIKDGDITIYKHPAGRDNFVHALHEDRQGTLWIGTRDGLEWLKEGALEPLASGWTSKGVRALWEGAEGSLWVGMEGGGLGRVKEERFETFTVNNGLTNNRVLALYGDREGSLWIGTEGGGLNRLVDGKLRTYSTSEHLSQDMVLAVYEDTEGVLWLGTEGGGLNRLHNGHITTYTTQDGLSSDVITSIYGDRNGNLWVGTLGGGLNRLRNGSFSHYTPKEGLPSDAIYALYEGSDGSLWIGTDAGLSHFQNGHFKNYTTEDGLGSDFVTAIHEDRQGKLWVGTYDAGLNQLHDGRFIAYRREDGLASNVVLAIHEDQEGTLWIGTYEGGLNRFREGRFTTYTTREGLFNDNVYQILEDEQGNLWMSCNKGVFQVAKTELEAFAEGKTGRLTSIAYGKADGLKNSEMNGGFQPAGWKGHDGKLWFPTAQGVAMIDPANLHRNTLAPPVVLEEVLVDQEPIDQTGTVELEPGVEQVEFHYTGLSFIASEKVSFRYVLDGYNTKWQEAGTSRIATYTNLGPGSYTFRVVARNSDGIWSKTDASLSFYLKPYFYQTNWFFALCALVLFLTAATGHRLRTRHIKVRKRELAALVDERTQDLRTAREKIEAQAEKLQELDRFKTRFFANVSHEFRTPLTMILGPLETALRDSSGVRLSRRRMEIMLRNALRLMRLINQLLDLSKLEAGKMILKARPHNIVRFIEAIVFTCTALAEQKNLALHFLSKHEDLQVYFEPDKLEKIFYNLLSNALKHTPAGGEIVVTVSERPAGSTVEASEDVVEISVRDTGKGIPEEELPYIFDRYHQVDDSNRSEHEGTGIGLALAKELVLLHQGAIDVQSEVEVGTEFTVTLPKGPSHLQPDQVALAPADVEEYEPEHGTLAEWAATMPGAREEGPVPSSKDHPVAHSEDTPLVLIVDDNADVREYIGLTLSDTYRIAAAKDGQEGFEQAHALKPDLIISDVMMPKMDGNEFCRRIKAHPDLHFTPIILLTARATHELRLEGLEVGADDYIAKPFNTRELRARVRNLVRLYQQERELQHLNENLEEKVQEQLETMLTQRERYEQELITAKEKAEASSRLKSAILNNMNHEFRTPLTVIQGYAQLLTMEVDGELKEFATDILRGGDRLKRTLDAVLELSRLEAGTLQINAESVDLVHLIRQVIERFTPAAREKGLALHFRTPTDEKTQAQLDPSALDHILDRLLDNAIEFTEEGEVTIEVFQYEQQVYIRVQDTGIGIGEAFLPHLFEAFSQESDGLSRLHEGMGLGLTITKQLTELMGGSILVKSEKGRGSVFTVRLPNRALPHRRTPARNQPKKGETA